MRMRRIFILLSFNHSGSGLKHGEIKTGVCYACAVLSPVDLQPFGIRQKAWRNNKREYVAHEKDFSPVDLQPL
jgi:hypothetical protein